ncbi:S4 domain-containing protein [Caldalkalibacillus salinus]
MLSEQIDEWSRTEIVKRILDGKIIVNNRKTKPSTKLKQTDLICILL